MEDIEPTRCPSCVSYSYPEKYPDIEGAYWCTACGYVYKPLGKKRSFTVIAKGPPNSNIEAGVYYVWALTAKEASEWKGSGDLPMKVLRVFEGNLEEAHE